MSFESLKNWSSQLGTICAEISVRSTPLKVLLKTKDDPAMLELWIQHHRKIVGLSGLLIFDNMSTDPQVEEIYNKYSPEVSIYRYPGFHNLIHHTEHFAPLYDAIRNSCSNFVFLDTDERLSLYDGEGFCSDSAIVSFLTERPSIAVFPGTWLQNISGYTDHFSLYDPNIPLSHGLKWGKPILSSKSRFAGMINHNTQIDHSLYETPITTNFFVLHLSRVSVQQRVSGNLRKLRAYQAIGKECDLAEFLSMPMDAFPTDQVRMYAREIHELIDNNASDRGALVGWIKIATDGQLTCAAPWQKKALASFLSSPATYTAELLS